ncbi:hypothetical protein RIF29_15097 [Crotalaria pallida]|uniref:Damage-control phosphatase ARMT1-like metal-binding domain-containing protein n=1 Tax=Crotalaria pallida TaxID=3830 RepID=A0AAN9ICB1_CROPI
MVIDLTRVSQELAYLAIDAGLVILEGMGRGIETNLYAQFKCDSLKIRMVKHLEVAQFLGGRLYDCVFKHDEVSFSQDCRLCSMLLKDYIIYMRGWRLRSCRLQGMKPKTQIMTRICKISSS